MKYIAVSSKFPILRKVFNKPDKAKADLNSIDRVILKVCEEEPKRIQQILHTCKPYVNQNGARMFATTGQVVDSVKKLVKLELLREV